MLSEKQRDSMSDKTFWKAHLTTQQSLTPSLDVLSSIRLTICLATVWCERGFSTMNLIKNKTRNSLKTKTLDDLMMCNLNGPPLDQKELVSQLLDKAYTRWISIRARNVKRSFRGARPKAKTARAAGGDKSDESSQDSEQDEVDSVQESGPADDDLEIPNASAYVPDTGFVVLPLPSEAEFAALIIKKFKTEGKHVYVAYKFDNGWQTGKWDSVTSRATRAESALPAAQVEIHIVKIDRVRFPVQLALASYGMEGVWCLVREEEPRDSEGS